MTMLNRGWSLILVVFLAACVGPQLYHGQLVALNLGMEPAQTVEKLSQPPLATQTVVVDGKEYLFHQYMLNNGVDSGRYFLAFEGGRLKYWGYIDDFRRHPDARLNRAIDAVLSDPRNQKK